MYVSERGVTHYDTNLICATVHVVRQLLQSCAVKQSSRMKSFYHFREMNFIQSFIANKKLISYYDDVIMGAIASQITSFTIVYSTVYSDADQRKHQSSASLAFVRGIHRGLVNSPHKWPVTREIFPFDDVIMIYFLHIPTKTLSDLTVTCAQCSILTCRDKHREYR